MKNKALTLLFVSISLVLFAQAPVAVWEKTYGGINDDEAMYAAPQPDGSIIVCGYTLSEGSGKKDIWLMKLSEKGEKEWDYTFGGEGDDIAYHFTIGKNGEIILAGSTDSWGKGKLDFLIMAVDQRGRMLWKQTYGGAKDDVLKRIYPLTDSTWLSFGETNSWGGGKTDLFMMQTDTSSKIIRRKTLGGSKNEKFGDVFIMPDTTFAIIGSTRSYTNGTFDAWFQRVDKDGRSKGRKNFGKQRYDYGNAIIPTPDQGYIIAGATNSDALGMFDGWVLKINRDLFEEWQAQPGDKKDDLFIAIVEHKKAYIAVGNTQSFGNGGYDLWMVGIGPRGDVRWSETYGNELNDFIHSFIPLDDGGFLACGYTTTNSAGGKDFWIVRFK